MMKRRKIKQKVIDKKEAKAKKARAQFEAACASVEKASANLRVKTAFITFGSGELRRWS